MNTKTIAMLVLAMGLLVFGALCVNYTKPSTFDHHRDWATENDAPPPSDTILVGGVACMCSGVALIGLMFVQRRRPSDPFA